MAVNKIPPDVSRGFGTEDNKSIRYISIPRNYLSLHYKSLRHSPFGFALFEQKKVRIGAMLPSVELIALCSQFKKITVKAIL